MPKKKKKKSERSQDLSTENQSLTSIFIRIDPTLKEAFRIHLLKHKESLQAAISRLITQELKKQS